MGRTRRRSLVVVVLSAVLVVPFFASDVFAAQDRRPPADEPTGKKKRPPRTTTTTRPRTTTTKLPRTTTTQPPRTTTTTAPPRGTNPTTVSYDVPAGITGDCSRDVTPGVMAWIASVPDNSILNFTVGACYQIENVLYLVDRHRLTFVGHGATFMAKTDGASQTPPLGVTKLHWPRRRAHWWLKDSSDITITDLTVIGANPASGQVPWMYDSRFEVQSGVVVSSSSKVTIDDVVIRKVWGDFLTVADSNEVVIRDSEMTTVGRQGIAVTSGSHVLIQGNTMDDVGWGMFDLEPNGEQRGHRRRPHPRQRDGVVALVLARQRRPEHEGVQHRRRGQPHDRQEPHGRVREQPDPDAGRRGPWTIAGNEFRMGVSTKYAAFMFRGSNDVDIHDNLVTPIDGATPKMVYVEASNHLRVHHNDFTGAPDLRPDRHADLVRSGQPARRAVAQRRLLTRKGARAPVLFAPGGPGRDDEATQTWLLRAHGRRCDAG